uniref:U1-type domain-containing protein n=1 Tax=Strigamia maritima TaxID=126957 RepID=T1JHH7_STRMM
MEEKKPEFVEMKIEKQEEEIEMEYDYFDPGGHWCKQCNQMLPHLHNFLQHLQDKKHIQGMDPYDRPWLPEALKNPPITKPKKGLIAAIKGVQFLKPVAAYYCSICSEFMGDASCAELHVKSKNHNYKYLVR